MSQTQASGNTVISFQGARLSRGPEKGELDEICEELTRLNEAIDTYEISGLASPPEWGRALKTGLELARLKIRSLAITAWVLAHWGLVNKEVDSGLWVERVNKIKFNPNESSGEDLAGLPDILVELITRSRKLQHRVLALRQHLYPNST